MKNKRKNKTKQILKNKIILNKNDFYIYTIRYNINNNINKNYI